MIVTASATALLASLSVPKGAASWSDCRGCPSMVALPQGGPTAYLHVSQTPVTFRHWRHCLRSGGCEGYRPDQQGLGADYPVVNVSFEDAQLYIRWLQRRTGRDYRLLRQDEWPWAMAGGDPMPAAWSRLTVAGRANCLDCASRWSGRSPSPVSAFPPNGFGLRDAAANVAVWTLSPAAGAKSLCAGKRSHAAIFGASWADPARFADPANATCFPTVLRDDTIGFRVAVEVPPASQRSSARMFAARSRSTL